ncbi:hypothetical protein [Undibacterium sp. YM2]|uniref:hypothetical protein n=1 Tax=Undibacterium sp. YM2 TaxID=2058625 RepID=UPI0013899E11|nr:hypothetical protein [Undibacterium sp. YM2]
MRLAIDASVTGNVNFSVEVALLAHLSITGIDTVILKRSLGMVFTYRDTATLHIDVDNFNVSLPRFKLPELAMPGAGWKLVMPTVFAGIARAAQSLGTQAAVAYRESNDRPISLAVMPSPGGGLDWALVTNQFDIGQPWGGQAAALATIEADFLLAGASILLRDMRVAQGTNLNVVDGQAQIQAASNPSPIFDAAPRMRRIGPLEISWQRITMQPIVAATGGVGEEAPPTNASLRLLIAFERLSICAVNDSDAVLTFSGSLEMDPSGTRLVSLELIMPNFPLLKLIAQAADEVVRAGASVIQVVFDLAVATDAQWRALFGILGRIATAVGKAAVFVDDMVSNAAGALAELSAGALAAGAELIGNLLQSLSNMMTITGLDVQLRIGTSPLELQQILISQRKPSGMSKVGALGFSFTAPPVWRPGLLIDVARHPGAFLVLSSADVDAATEVATLSTDLWLKRTGNGGNSQTSALRDADGETGDAPEEPLLKLALTRAAGTPAQTMIVLAGLQRGQPVFFKELKGTVAPLTGSSVVLAGDDFDLEDLDTGFDVDVTFESKRVLPLLGMGEPSENTPVPGGFLSKLQNSLSNVVWVESCTTDGSLAERAVTVNLVLGLKAAGLQTSITLEGKISLNTLELTLDASDVFPILSPRIEEEALGLIWIVEQTDDTARKIDTPVKMFQLAFSGGQSGFELNHKEARMELHFNGLSSDGKGVVFEVTTLKIGPGGLDLTAKVSDRAVKLNGVDVPFRFTSGSLEIKAGKLVKASIGGRGTLPPALIGEADCSIVLDFAEDGANGIVLQSGKVELDKKNEPIICHASRFTLTVTDLDLAFVRDGGYHFYYLVTGSLRFTPKDGEFNSGLLQYLDGVELDLERTPLSADPRVLAKHISFQKALNPKKSFNLFNLFTFELRGFGYHPASPKFDGKPAVNLSGQIKFVEIGDIMQPSIDFHGLWIAPPAEGQSLPRIKADGLGIDLNLKGAIRVRGTVIAVDPDTKTVEGGKLAPDGYNTYGFLGRGEFDIPGWGSMGASLGFMELERKDKPGERRKSFYFYADQKKLAIEIPTVVWNFYLREAGFGLGFRYTLDAIAAADRQPSVPKLIKALDDVAKVQGDLHKFSAWKSEPEGDRVTLALKGAIQVYPASKTWDEEEEEAAQNPFLFDLVAAIRSDMTLFMGLRGWIGTNYIDYLKDKDNLRSNPGLRGYLYISAPQQRLLARMIGDSKGYIGDRLPALKKAEGNGDDPPLRRALKSVDWSATLFIKPGLFHYELGWPNQLVVRLFDEKNMRVTVRGGMIFRAADDGLLWGYNIEADAYFEFGGQYQAGPIGLCARATLTASLVARLLCYLTWRVKGSLVYGLIALDATLAVAVRAWMEVDLGFTSFNIDIGFTVKLQFSAAVEVAISTEGVGARVHARVAVSVFGCTLSVSVGFEFGTGQLESARSRVQRFLAMSITAEEPDTLPEQASKTGDQRIEADAQHAQAPLNAVPPKKTDPVVPGLPAGSNRSYLGESLCPTDFWLALRRAIRAPDGTPAPAGYGYAVLIPREARPVKPLLRKASDRRCGFYAAGMAFAADGLRDESTPSYSLKITAAVASHPAMQLVGRVKANSGELVHDLYGQAAKVVDISTGWNRPVATVDGGTLTLGYLFDECFLSDTIWKGDASKFYRITEKWAEPAPRAYGEAQAVVAGSVEERSAQRDMVQRQRETTARTNPVVEAVHQARSTVMAMFVQQFEKLCEQGLPAAGGNAHVRDVGLLFYGPLDALEALAGATIEKLEGMARHEGTITLLNPQQNWFERQDPVLGADTSRVDADGIKLDWVLQTRFTGTSHEHFLHHYEIVRTCEGAEFKPRTMQVKPSATIGGAENGEVTLLRPECQFVDDLSDLTAELRNALLPHSDDKLALEGAKAWARIYGDKESVSVTYTVTPFDIAGTPGLAKSFLIDIRKPKAPLRPAEAELRFIVKNLNGKPNTATPFIKGTPPADALAVLIAVKDASASKPGDEIKRYYHLIAEPENISPSGHYGSDGLTERRLGIGNADGHSAAAMVWKLETDGGQFIKVTNPDGEIARGGTDLDPIEPDHDTQRKFPLWCWLDGEDLGDGLDRAEALLKGRHPPPLVTDDGEIMADFLASLWRRVGSGERVATRFTLVTVQSLKVKNSFTGKMITVKSYSKPTPVAIEMRIEPRRPKRIPGAPASDDYEIGLMRPEAFEWPVHLEFPAHQPGQVRVHSGFARFRVPAAYAVHRDMIERHPPLLMRDPERRLLTSLQFEAAPRLSFDAGLGMPDAAHARTVAGFDVHELDVDELAPLDTVKQELETSVAPWRRARRVARVERVSPETARLMPDANKDWPSWLAHYPSQTWRLINRHLVPAGHSQPRLAPWYSAAESTVRFPTRVVRMRLMPTVAEGHVSDLLAKGLPKRLEARLVARPRPDLDVAAAKLAQERAADIVANSKLLLAHVFPCATYPGSRLRLTYANDKSITTTITRWKMEAFNAAWVRGTLLRLAWEPRLSGIDGHTAFACKDVIFELFVDSIVEGTEASASTHVAIPLKLTSETHPLLEEVLGALEYSYSNDLLYRRYVVANQPVQPVAAKDLPSFLSDTQRETDPYGWSVLQCLGLARTFKLFDKEQDRFADASEVHALVEPVLRSAVLRYQKLGTDLGQPFVEVLLQPGRDRKAGPFDAILRDGDIEPESDALDLKDEGLAIAQISLRPKPAAGRLYTVISLKWEKANWPRTLLPGHKLLGYELEFSTTTSNYEVLSVEDDRILDVLVGQPAHVPLRRWPVSLASAETCCEMRFLLRHATIFGLPRLRAIVRSGNGEDAQIALMTLAELKNVAEDIVGFPEHGVDMALEPIDTPAASQCVNAFGKFKALSADQWSSIMTAPVTGDNTKPAGAPRSTDLPHAAAALASLRANLLASAPELLWPGKDGPLRFADCQIFMSAYLDWCDRLLEHGAAPGPQPRHAVAIAFAAPKGGNPLHLAANSNGQIGLSLLHSDRWAHARAYAVRPTPRYQNLALGAGYFPDQSDSERLVTPALYQGDKFKLQVGYALAVSPRTERIEPPVILGSRLTDAQEWELVVARHGEEALAFSNRPLFARLGTQGTAISFVREYRNHNWPARLAHVIEGAAPDAIMYPKSEASLPVGVPANAKVLRGGDLGDLADKFPALWKGADIWRIGHLPPHYRVSALGVARAGIVVSRVVGAVQDATPRRALNVDQRGDTVSLGKPTLSVADIGGVRGIHIGGLRLIAHADIAMLDSLPSAPDENDIVWWPDPNVRYTLLRRGPAPNQSTFEEEDASVSLVAEGPVNGSTAAVVVRCRGTRFVEAAASQDGDVRKNPVVTYSTNRFDLGFDLKSKDRDPAAMARSIRLPAANDLLTERRAFNRAATNFASLSASYELVLKSFQNAPDDHAMRKAWLEQEYTILLNSVNGLTDSVAREALLPVLDVYKTIIDALPPGPIEVIPPQLLELRSFAVMAQGFDNHVVIHEANFTLTATFNNLEVLTVHALPLAIEEIEVRASGHPAGGTAWDSPLWVACRERLLGAANRFVVRAVDTRNAIQKNGNVWQVPGETEVEIALPVFAQKENQVWV